MLEQSCQVGGAIGTINEKYIPTPYGAAAKKAADNKTQSVNYDSSGAVKSIKEASGRLTHFDQDPTARKQSLSRDGRETVTETDRAGRTSKITYPDGSYESYSYHPRGMLKSIQQRDGSVISYEYDAKDRLTFVKNGQSVLRSFSNYNDFNQAQRMEEYGAYGKVVTLRQYDNLGRLTREESLGKVLTYDYDQHDRLTQATYPDGTQVEYAYNAKALLDKIKVNGNTVYQLQYDNTNLSLTAEVFEGSGKQLDYDYLNQALGLVSKLTFASNTVATYK